MGAKAGIEATIRVATKDDAASIKSVVDTYRFRGDGSGQLIPVTEGNILEVIASQGFAVAEVDGQVIGISSVVEYDGLAEMRSWAVLPGYHGKGIGSRLAKESAMMAAKKGYGKLYTLTQEQNFGAVQDLRFSRTELPPEKLAKDCAKCPIYDKCNETAFVMVI